MIIETSRIFFCDKITFLEDLYTNLCCDCAAFPLIKVLKKRGPHDTLKIKQRVTDIAEGVIFMKQQRKNTIMAILEQLLPVVLAFVCILVMTVNTHQSMMAVPLPLNFEGVRPGDCDKMKAVVAGLLEVFDRVDLSKLA